MRSSLLYSYVISDISTHFDTAFFQSISLKVPAFFAPFSPRFSPKPLYLHGFIPLFFSSNPQFTSLLPTPCFVPKPIHPHPISALYLNFLITFKSLAGVSGLQDTKPPSPHAKYFPHTGRKSSLGTPASRRIHVLGHSTTFAYHILGIFGIDYNKTLRNPFLFALFTASLHRIGTSLDHLACLLAINPMWSQSRSSRR